MYRISITNDNKITDQTQLPPDMNLPACVRAIVWYVFVALRKHAYSNTLKILPPQNEKFQIKNSDIFHISAQNIVCGYSLEPPQRGGSNEYPQSMF